MYVLATSPDLNKIEKVWDILLFFMHYGERQLSDVEILQKTLTAACHIISLGSLFTRYRSTSSRLVSTVQ